MEEIRVIGARVKQLREANQWTQGQLAYRADTSSAQINRIENNKRPRVSAIIVGRVARALDTSMDYLLGLTNSPLSGVQVLAEGEGAEDEVTQQALSLLRRLPDWRAREELERLRLAVEMEEAADYHIIPKEKE
jgi:transcriptional regulator with XRE-family HTH domain